jgi:hypothetical protein
VSAAEDAVQRLRERLLGLSCVIARRAADLRGFHFGAVTQDMDRRGRATSYGEVILHIQSPWRITLLDRLVTGRSDLWEPAQGVTWSESWTYEQGNRQDELLETVFDVRDAHTKGRTAPSGRLIVTSFRVGALGALTITMSGGLVIETFSDAGPQDEQWRMFTWDGEVLVVVTGDGGVSAKLRGMWN